MVSNNTTFEDIKRFACKELTYAPGFNGGGGIEKENLDDGNKKV